MRKSFLIIPLFILPLLGFNQEINTLAAYNEFYNGLEKSKSANYSEAIKHFESAIEIDSTYKEAYLRMASMEYNLNNTRCAIDILDKIIGIESNYASAYHNRGFFKSTINNYVGAIEDYTKALEIDPDNVCHTMRGDMKYNIGDYSGAIADYTYYIDSTPYNMEEDPDAYFARGKAYREIKNNEAADLDFKKANELYFPAGSFDNVKK
ncbi:MAG: hypothetical protein COB15_03290 [Flavobacteriales bacterium]|nr:MAG: hypothetical protein COB15_03290 [Flavobacteriales bacterium]